MIAAHGHDQKAQAYTQAAQDLMAVGNANGAIGRAFFAMLHATLARYPDIEEDIDVGSAGAGGIVALTERLGRDGFPPALLVMLERAFNMRLSAELGTVASRPEDASQAVAMMTNYLAKLNLLPAATARGKTGGEP